jgi:signal transduction histidine kinase
MKSIDIIFALNIICFNVYTKSILILLVLVLVVLDLVIALVLVFVLCLVLCLVFCLRLNRLDEQRALSLNSSHLTELSSSERVRIARIVATLNFQTLILSQLKFSHQYDSSSSNQFEDSSRSSSIVVDFSLSKNDRVILSFFILVHKEENQ